MEEQCNKFINKNLCGIDPESGVEQNYANWKESFVETTVG